MSDAAFHPDALPATTVVPTGGSGDPGPDDNVVELARKGTAKVKIDRGQNPLAAMSEDERMRLIIRVLCELVAYGDADGEHHAAAS